eukprot:TRINITY_DN1037_c0_g3_i1.p1 TRINITY_DN1037_c0_g3~~TRINITY_DN1037_c0_g3_i1.p1  ORF type:complete len:1319 (+),score=409.91 TRINITY_DN1037_c0_g3_i1:104-4060(+)
MAAAGFGGWEPGWKTREQEKQDEENVAQRVHLLLMKRRLIERRNELEKQKLQQKEGVKDGAPPSTPGPASTQEPPPPTVRFPGVPDFRTFVAVRSIAALTGEDVAAPKRARPSPFMKVLDDIFETPSSDADVQPAETAAAVPPEPEPTDLAVVSQVLLEEIDAHARLRQRLRALLHGGGDAEGWAPRAAARLLATSGRWGAAPAVGAAVEDERGGSAAVSAPVHAVRRAPVLWGGVASDASYGNPSLFSVIAESGEVPVSVPVASDAAPLPPDFAELFLPNYAYDNGSGRVRQGPIARSVCTYDQGAAAEGGVGRCNNVQCTYLHPHGHAVVECIMLGRLLDAIGACPTAAARPGFAALVEKCAKVREQRRGDVVNSTAFRDLLEEALMWVRRHRMFSLRPQDSAETLVAKAVPRGPGPAPVIQPPAPASPGDDELFVFEEVKDAIAVPGSDHNLSPSGSGCSESDVSDFEREGDRMIDAPMEPAGGEDEGCLAETGGLWVPHVLADAVRRLVDEPQNHPPHIVHLAAALDRALLSSPTPHAFAKDLRRLLARPTPHPHPLTFALLALEASPPASHVPALAAAVKRFKPRTEQLIVATGPDDAPGIGKVTEAHTALVEDFSFWVASNGRAPPAAGAADPSALLLDRRFVAALARSPPLQAPGAAAREKANALSELVAEARAAEADALRAAVEGAWRPAPAPAVRAAFEAWLKGFNGAAPCDLIGSGAVLGDEWYDPWDRHAAEGEGVRDAPLLARMRLYPDAEVYTTAHLAAQVRAYPPLKAHALSLPLGQHPLTLAAGDAAAAALPEFEAALARHPQCVGLVYVYVEALARAPEVPDGARRHAAICRVAGVGLDRALAGALRGEDAASLDTQSETLFAMILLNAFVRQGCAGAEDNASGFFAGLLRPTRSASRLAAVLTQRHLACLPVLYAAAATGAFPKRLAHVWALMAGMPLALPPRPAAAVPSPASSRAVSPAQEPAAEELPSRAPSCGEGAPAPVEYDAAVEAAFARFLERPWTGRVRDALVVARADYLSTCGRDAAAVAVLRAEVADRPARAAVWARLAAAAGSAAACDAVFREAWLKCGRWPEGAKEKAAAPPSPPPPSPTPRGILEDLAKAAGRESVPKSRKRKRSPSPNTEGSKRANGWETPETPPPDTHQASLLCAVYFRHLVLRGAHTQALRLTEHAWLAEPFGTYLRACAALYRRQRKEFADAVASLVEYSGDAAYEEHLQREVVGYRATAPQLTSLAAAVAAAWSGARGAGGARLGVSGGGWREWVVLDEASSFVGDAMRTRVAEAMGAPRPGEVPQFLECAEYR